jgi:hypothetical protein
LIPTEWDQEFNMATRQDDELYNPEMLMVENALVSNATNHYCKFLKGME